jgi:hypothetical protein
MAAGLSALGIAKRDFAKWHRASSSTRVAKTWPGAVVAYLSQAAHVAMGKVHATLKLENTKLDDQLWS